MANAYEIPGFSWTLVADEDLTESQHCAIDLNNEGKAILPTQGGSIVGVCRNKPDVDESVTVVSSGIVMGKVGATGLVAGDNVTVDDDGTFIQASGANLVHGRALKTNAADEITAILLFISSNEAGS